MKTLILTFGFPYSGKRAWAQEYSFDNDTPIIDLEEIHKASTNSKFNGIYNEKVYQTALLSIKTLFKTNQSHIILISTNLSTEERKYWKSENWKIQYKVFPKIKRRVH